MSLPCFEFATGKERHHFVEIGNSCRTSTKTLKCNPLLMKCCAIADKIRDFYKNGRFSPFINEYGNMNVTGAVRMREERRQNSQMRRMRTVSFSIESGCVSLQISTSAFREIQSRPFKLSFSLGSRYGP